MIKIKLLPVLREKLIFWETCYSIFLIADKADLEADWIDDGFFERIYFFCVLLISDHIENCSEQKSLKVYVLSQHWCKFTYEMTCYNFSNENWIEKLFIISEYLQHDESKLSWHPSYIFPKLINLLILAFSAKKNIKKWFIQRKNFLLQFLILKILYITN